MLTPGRTDQHVGTLATVGALQELDITAQYFEGGTQLVV